MMKTPNYISIAVRAENGKIVTDLKQYKNLIVRYPILNIPLIRGVINMFEMLYVGTKALKFSSDIYEGQHYTNTKDKKIHFEIITWLSVFFGIFLALVLFKFLPLLVTDWISSVVPFLADNYFFYNIIDGILKILIFIGYIALISLIPDIKRVFMYHGAEHKSIMTYERGLPLTAENALKQSRFHPRCGTSFILLIFIVSVLLLTVIPKNPDFWLNLSQRVLALPLIAGVSYEILKASAKKTDSLIFKFIAWPGLMMQKLTTQEPDKEILEVAIESIKKSLQEEEKNINMEVL